ncbi:MAG: response regulator [Myxococcaceae bacterium]|nr:response regulator [Myxococcaceae bacterium]
MSLLRTRRILVLDDDEAQRDVLSEILGLEGAEVLNATTWEEAARLLSDGADLVLMDLHGVDADRLMRHLRATGSAPKVLLVSGDATLRQQAERLQVDRWLAKPYDVDQLLDAVKDLLAPAEGGPEHPSP